MAPGEERRGGPESGEDSFDGRDLLVGRPEGAEARSTTGAAGSPPAATSPQPGTHDDAIQEILETVRVTAARIDAIRDAPGPDHEAAEALARGTAALTQAVDDARGTLSKAAELTARRDGQGSAGARAPAEGAAALRTQGEALDKRLRATGRQAQAAADGMAEMKQAATVLDSRLRTLAEDILRNVDRLRRRPWLIGLAIGAASFVFFVLGAVLQRETDVVSFGDPRHEWNEHVVERYAPTLAACASRARLHEQAIRCYLHIDPSWDMTVPLYPDVNLEKVPPDEDPEAER